MKKVIILSFILILLALALVSASCVDTDNGKNYNTPGLTSGTGANGKIPDSCQIERGDTGVGVSDCSGSDCKLLEGYCSDNEVEIERHVCETGCKDGHCKVANDQNCVGLEEDCGADTGKRCCDGYNCAIIEGFPNNPGKCKASTSCEAAGYYCAPSIWACQNAGGFLFPQSTYSCDNHLQSCCTVDVAEMTCREIGGQVCNWNAPCTEATIESTDGPCCLAECEETQGTTKEKVECIFANSNSKQSCYASFNSRGCSGVESCTAEVSGRKGEKIIWKSSCGGYAYTIIDGKNEYAKFDCSQGTEPSYKGWYRNAYWVCFDGTKKEEGGPTSCKSPRVWKNYAEKDCEGKCSDDREKCGINTFGVYNECLGRSILDVLPTCGNGICEPGEGETCVAASIACEQNKECLAKFNKCFYNCVQDCRYQKEIEVSFDEKFKLQISQTATVKGHTFSMKFNDLNIESCDDESIPQPTTAASAVSIQTYDGITGNTVLNSDPIMEFSFIEASPIDSVERITSAEVNELFALYGNIDDLGELHYVEYILPSGCGFENNEPSYGLGGSFVEGSTTKKVFSADTVTHNFAFHSFKCSSEGTYTFKLKLYNSDNEKIDSKTATIKIGEGSPNSQALLCSDSDGGVNPFEKGKCKDSRGTTVEDACVREDGSGPTSEGAYVYEAFCLTDKMIEYCKNYNSAEYCENLPRDCYAGGLIPDPNLAWSYFPYNKKYFCPNGCKDGVCLGEEGTTPEHPSCDKEPYAVLQVKYAMLPEKKLYTEVIKLQVGEKKQVGNVIISFLDFDTGLKSGLFYLTQNDPDFNCPENCKCDINNNKIKCWDIEECPEGTLLCQDGSCQEKCDIIGGDKQCTFGCTYNENCLPIGTRSDNFYCSVEGGMKSQKPAGESCKNNFECTSNLCISDQCIDEGLFKRIVIWFKKLFGTE
jgi:hypothetical protein